MSRAAYFPEKTSVNLNPRKAPEGLRPESRKARKGSSTGRALRLTWQRSKLSETEYHNDCKCSVAVHDNKVRVVLKVLRETERIRSAQAPIHLRLFHHHQSCTSKAVSERGTRVLI